MGPGCVIVNTSSTAGLRGYAQPGPNTASKHGVVGLTKSAALECASDGIRILSVHPAAIETPMVSRAMKDNPDFANAISPACTAVKPQENRTGGPLPSAATSTSDRRRKMPGCGRGEIDLSAAFAAER